MYLITHIATASAWVYLQAELNALTGKVLRDFVFMALPFEPLTVERKFAADLFAENEFVYALFPNWI